jgi:hypothetical protein
MLAVVKFGTSWVDPKAPSIYRPVTLEASFFPRGGAVISFPQVL